MPGSNIVCTQIFRSKLQESFKFYFFITQNIGVRGAPGFVFFQEQFEHVIPVFCGKIDGVQLHAQFVAYRLSIGQIGRC
ncbi:Uncharacterised protein [Yersinia enterocolitica]|nr:Uncharacterised protein [Yersinia enterocolitica]